MSIFDQSVLQQAAAMTDRLFEELRAGSFDPVSSGVCRDTYGAGEQFAHDLVRQHAQSMGLSVWHDHLLNTYMSLEGADTGLPAIVIGSHLDSVHSGGNYDGAAGVVAGLVAAKMLAMQGIRLERNLTVMGVRAEESMWFQHSYIGSRGALGTLDPEALCHRRVDTGRTLETYLMEAGGDPQAVRARRAVLSSSNVEAFFEVHIEQAPSLAADGYPVAVGTAIPGNVRYAHARIVGEYGHVGLPKRFRHDAALAGAELFVAMQTFWEQEDAAGRPMAFTIGEFHTDSTRHGLTIVAGEFQFSIDMRAYDSDHLAAIEAKFLETVRQIEARHGVRFELGPRSSAPVALADPQLSADLREAAERLEIEATDLLSPASHDAAAFNAAGIPYGFLFVRNDNGSHHPQEHMDHGDFMLAVRVLAEMLVKRYGCGSVVCRAGIS